MKKIYYLLLISVCLIMAQNAAAQDDGNAENQTEKIEETVANESEKFEKSQKDTDYPDSSEVNLVDENSVTEEIPLTGKVEESQESEDTSKTTAFTSMRLYKRKSRRQHK